ncbi:hypothetical protein SAY87_013962 [Trapa incisa]|uniref:TLC domain-containing protein n=1 Tax=Trapa incisa TaxID=236973 RepID=A0AAN7QDQ7_9MYRT|nr:hypothetical protein SAY87_013962 [Trapa incisa]
MLEFALPSSFMSSILHTPSEVFRWLASIFLGITMCIIVYQVTGVISLLCFNDYGRLGKKERLEWKNRGFSTFHAIVIAFASLYLLLFSDQFKGGSHSKSVINNTSTLSDSVLGVILQYVIFILLMVKVLHHGLSMFSIFLSLMSGQGQIYILMVLFTESTTPFVNLRWYLDVAGLKNSKLYMFNGIMLFTGWLVARMSLFIIFFFHMYLHFDEVKQIFDLGFYSLLLVPPILTLMNIFWFWKIVKDLVKILSKARHSS